MKLVTHYRGNNVNYRRLKMKCSNKQSVSFTFFNFLLYFLPDSLDLCKGPYVLIV